MRKYDLITPEGTKDFLFEECLVRHETEAKLYDIFKSKGYYELTTPALEFYDVFQTESGHYPQERLYKLTDSIHWYKEYTDKELLDGLSGGPVYAQKRDINYLLGINQSLCNVGDGNNPFKIVYYIQIRQVFEWLREQGILLFEYNNGKIQI